MGARDAIFRSVVDASIAYAQDRTGLSVESLGDQNSDFPETRLMTALAADLNLEEERAVGFVRAGVAAAARARLLEVSVEIKS